MLFLQPTQCEAYAKNAVSTQPLKLEKLQPFSTLTQRCGSKTQTKAKQARLNHVTVLDYFFAVSLAFEATSTIQPGRIFSFKIEDLL